MDQHFLSFLFFRSSEAKLKFDEDFYVFLLLPWPLGVYQVRVEMTVDSGSCLDSGIHIHFLGFGVLKI